MAPLAVPGSFVMPTRLDEHTMGFTSPTLHAPFLPRLSCRTRLPACGRHEFVAFLQYSRKYVRGVRQFTPRLKASVEPFFVINRCCLDSQNNTHNTQRNEFSSQRCIVQCCFLYISPEFQSQIRALATSKFQTPSLKNSPRRGENTGGLLRHARHTDQ